MAESTFLYVTYIRTTPEKLWEALTSAEFNRIYWVGCWQESTWEAGASWKLFLPDGRLGDAGQILEVEKPRRLVLEWRNEFMPDLKEEGYSRCTFELEPNDEMVRLTITHTMPREESKFVQAVSNGWPKILSSLKSLLETGAPLAAANKWPKGL
jgi:uncharacterized protein YndB with AHSA1/START domain